VPDHEAGREPMVRRGQSDQLVDDFHEGAVPLPGDVAGVSDTQSPGVGGGPDAQRVGSALRPRSDAVHLDHLTVHNGGKECPARVAEVDEALQLGELCREVASSAGVMVSTPTTGGPVRACRRPPGL
jgi:hypothetical protein